MNKNILLCGVGGQGTVLASKLIASAAMARGIPVMSAETIGMAQKGGSVFSFIRMGEGLCTPMIPEKGADIIIAFEPAEAVRVLPYLKENGSVIVNSCPVKPVTETLQNTGYDGTEMIAYLEKKVRNLTVVNCDEACSALGSDRVANMVLLGAALETGELSVSKEDIREALRKRLRESLWELNFRALDYSVEH